MKTTEQTSQTILLIDRAYQETPHWATTKILPYDPRFEKAKQYVLSKYWCSSATINVFLVVGTQHPDYIGLTWLEFLKAGKRMKENLHLHSVNRSYYLETEIKQPIMYYETLDGLNYYVAGDGNHRTCIAKFDFHYTGLSMLHGVNLTDYRIDWDLMSLGERIQESARMKNIALSVEVQNERISRIDTGGWMLEHYRLRLKILQHKMKEQILNREEAQTFLTRLERPKRFGLF